MTVTIDNPPSGLKIEVHPDDAIIFDEMLREMASEMIEWLNDHDKGADIREGFEFAISSALGIAKRRGCSEADWYKFAGYAGLLAAQAFAQPLWKVNQ